MGQGDSPAGPGGRRSRTAGGGGPIGALRRVPPPLRGAPHRPLAPGGARRRAGGAGRGFRLRHPRLRAGGPRRGGPRPRRRRFEGADDKTLGALALCASAALQNAARFAQAKRDGDQLFLFGEASSEALWDWNPGTDALWWSGGIRKILGGGGLEAGASGEWRLSRIHPEDVERVRTTLGRAQGSARPSWREEYRFLRADGSWAFVEDRAYFIRDAEGRAFRVVGALVDVTDRKGAEEALRKSQERLRQVEKMDAIGRLAGGVAHDFNNLLTVILGYGDILLTKLPAEDPSRAPVKEMVDAGRRAVGLTRQLLAFCRKQVIQPRPIDLNAAVSDMGKMLGRLLGEDVSLAVLPGEGLWPVFADPGQVEQVLLNLVVNARDAMPRGGKLAIETRNVDLDEPYVRGRPEARPGPHVLLSVSDTGCGMDEAVLSRLFEPFFTTKELGKGTGLGLSTVYGIVKQAGGHVGVYSEVGRGTTFKVYLPRFEGPVKEAEEARALPEAPRGGGTILVAEDSETIRRLVVAVLDQAGYKVLAACHGVEALRALEGHSGPVDLLVTDAVMPEMGGSELALHAARARPGIRILFTSGYTERGLQDQGGPAGGVDFLEKPFTPASLLRKVREVMAGKEAK